MNDGSLFPIMVNEYPFIVEGQPGWIRPCQKVEHFHRWDVPGAGSAQGQANDEELWFSVWHEYVSTDSRRSN